MSCKCWAELHCCEEAVVFLGGADIFVTGLAGVDRDETGTLLCGRDWGGTVEWRWDGNCGWD